MLSNTLTLLVPHLSREPHLRTPFSLLYDAPHNAAIAGAGDEHARIIDQLPEDTVGEPDACLEYDNRLAGVIEVKSFWNLTETGILELLQDSPIFGDSLTLN